MFSYSLCLAVFRILSLTFAIFLTRICLGVGLFEFTLCGTLSASCTGYLFTSSSLGSFQP